MGDYLGSVALPSMKQRQKKLCQVKSKPRAEPVYNDNTNFGVRMLAKLGWSEGKGLGKREDGMAAPILPTLKQDGEGFGYAGEKDNHWTQHDQDFNQLLKVLNGEEASAGDQVELKKIKSLEEKSKKSRARVHYKKFTRGKDLSRATEKDLANIFGKKSLDEVNYQSSEIETKEEIQENKPESEETNILGLTTVTATMSLQDYFKSKMRNKFGSMGNDPKIVAGENQELHDQLLEVSQVEHIDIKEKKYSGVELSDDVRQDDNSEECMNEISKKKSKKSKRKRKLEQSQESESKKSSKLQSEELTDCNLVESRDSEEKAILEASTEAIRRSIEQLKGNADNSEEQIVHETLIQKLKKKKKGSKLRPEELSVSSIPNISNLVESHDSRETAVLEASTEAVRGSIEQLEGSKSINSDNSEEQIVQETIQKLKKKKKGSKLRSEELSDSSILNISNLVGSHDSRETAVLEASAQAVRKSNEQLVGHESMTADNSEEQIVQETSIQKLKKKKGTKVRSDEWQDSSTSNISNPIESHDSTKEILLHELSAKAGRKEKKRQSKIESETISNDSEVTAKKDDGCDDEITCLVKAAVLKQLNEHGFPGSNFADIVGYGLTHDVKLINRIGNRTQSLEKHQFIRQKLTSLQRKRQMLKKPTEIW
ncbi:uncharacterized protein LOC131679717 isoform X2 [Topomyia yanbarensis]|uniref:uncharacterized protein LOC131679717 isoform X2 n=1 Tax=Topomyia yanbarensis TaxID=2498891 RepID=UPI00273BA528|nr:uncharacterized protein LOC131679717 isoform X2 [Topomyia yanbarensis]